jgi:hypothetical protein
MAGCGFVVPGFAGDFFGGVANFGHRAARRFFAREIAPGISRLARSSKSVQRDMSTVTLIMIGLPESIPALSAGELSPNI